jgi:two-component system, cell cycle sensor histidine kinase and response regulator CckA
MLRKKILVVEDEGLIADDIRRRLERLGYAVPATASSGEEALRLARSVPFDLVLMDIRLKGDMDGIDAAQQLRAEFRAPVVYLTAHADQDTVGRATLTEPFGYILKPIAEGNLRTTVQIALYKHEMERRLRVSEAWLSTTLRSMGEGIIATDCDGNIVFMNAVAARLTGWTPTEAQGRPLMDAAALIDETTGEPARNPIFDLLPEETRAYILTSRDGHAVPVEAACFENRTAAAGSDGAELLGAILVLRDIRARREWEAYQTQSQRMDAIAALAAGLSAEFESLLATVASEVDQLGAQSAGVRRSLSRARAFASQFAALSRGGPLLPEIIDVNRAIQSFRDVLSVCLGPRVTLESRLPSHTGFIYADPNRFHQVLLNLAVYSRDAMPQGGALTVETSILDLDSADSLSRRYPHRWYVRVRFVHTGPAPAPDSLIAIFEPSFSPAAENAFGLSIAHGAVSQAGGFINAADRSFEILWPCIATHRTTPHAQSSILLLEEEDALRREMSLCLQDEGYPVLEAKAAAAAELLAALRVPIAAIVTEEAGAPLAARLNIPAFLLSGYRHHGMPDPRVLAKPFPMAEFRRRMRAFLAVGNAA